MEGFESWIALTVSSYWPSRPCTTSLKTFVCAIEASIAAFRSALPMFELSRALVSAPPEATTSTLYGRCLATLTSLPTGRERAPACRILGFTDPPRPAP